MLFEIFPEYDYLLLDVVYDELSGRHATKTMIDNYINYFHRLKKENFNPKGDSLKEYFLLQRRLGKGESACMVYCRDNLYVLGSSNLKDIKKYCAKNKIVYLTTLDFLRYAYCRNLMTEQECSDFIKKVKMAGSRLKDIDIAEYDCKVHI